MPSAPVRPFRIAAFSCGLAFLFAACGGGDNGNKPDGSAGSGGGGGSHGDGAAGAAGGGGAGGAPHDGGAGTGGQGGTPTDGGGGNATDGPRDTADGSQAGIAWRAYLPLATSSSSNDGGTMGTTDDTSGNGYNATYFGPGVSFGNSAMSLAGTGTETVVIPAKSGNPVIDVRGSYSVSAWVTMTDVGGFKTVVGGEGYNISSFFLQKRGDMNNVFTFTQITADAIAAPACIAPSTVSPTVGTLYHLVATRDASSGLAIIYVNGAESGRTTCQQFSWMDTGVMGIGHGVFAGGRTDRVAGAISQVGLIDRVLTAAEVSAIYHARVPGGPDGGADGGGDASGDAASD